MITPISSQSVELTESQTEPIWRMLIAYLITHSYLPILPVFWRSRQLLLQFFTWYCQGFFGRLSHSRKIHIILYASQGNKHTPLTFTDWQQQSTAWTRLFGRIALSPHLPPAEDAKTIRSDMLQSADSGAITTPTHSDRPMPTLLSQDNAWLCKTNSSVPGLQPRACKREVSCGLQTATFSAACSSFACMFSNNVDRCEVISVFDWPLMLDSWIRPLRAEHDKRDLTSWFQNLIFES